MTKFNPSSVSVLPANVAFVLARVSGLRHAQIVHNFNEEILQEWNEDHVEEAQEELDTVNAATQHLQHTVASIN